MDRLEPLQRWTKRVEEEIISYRFDYRQFFTSGPFDRRAVFASRPGPQIGVTRGVARMRFDGSRSDDVFEYHAGRRFGVASSRRFGSGTHEFARSKTMDTLGL
jgi:hypothetical protein